MRTFESKQSQAEKREPAALARSHEAARDAARFVDPVLSLHHTIGNQAVRRLLRAAEEGPETGTAAEAAGRTPRDPGQTHARQTGGALQAKLVIGGRGDAHEQEAEQVADRVVSGARTRAGSACGCAGGCPKCLAAQAGTLQAKPAGGNGLDGAAPPPIVHEVLDSPGEPLDPSTRTFMESRLGHDLGRVRVHADARSAESARAVGALAFTVGPSIVFGEGQFAPQTTDGLRLLAHELAHVLQQTAAGPGGASRATPRLQRQIVPGGEAGPFNVSLRMPPAPAERHENLARDEALRTLRYFHDRVQGRVEAGEEGHRYLTRVREDQYIVGAISDVLGGFRSIPPLSIWDQPRRHLSAAQRTLEAGSIMESARHLQAAADATRHCDLTVYQYREGTISGAGRAQFGLEVVQVAAAATVTIGTGGTAGVFVGAGYGAVQAVARQGTEVSLGLRSRIDWAGVGFDTLVGLATGYLGGRLGNAVVGRLMRNPAAASLGRRLLANAVGDVIGGRVSSLLHTAARTVFDNLRGQENITVEQFIERLADQMVDPRGLVLDTIMGHAARRGAARIDAARAASPANQPAPSPRRRPTSSARGRLLGAVMRGMVEAAPVTGRTGGTGPSVTTAPSGMTRARTPEAAHTQAPAETTRTPSAGGGLSRPAAQHPDAPSTAPRPPAPPSATHAETPPAPTPPARPTRAAEEGLEIDTSPQPTREVSHNEIDPASLGHPGDSPDLDYGPQPTREVGMPELTEPAMEANASRVARQDQFGAPSEVRGGTEARAGGQFREYNAAEVANRLRVDYDPVAGRPRSVSYTINRSAATARRQSERDFNQDRSTPGAQPRDESFTGSGTERGHMAQREAARGDADVERAFDLLTGVVPQRTQSNRGRNSEWRASERRAMDWAVRHGSVDVRVEIIYDANPPRLPDGTPIPRAFRRRITAPDGTLLEDITHLNL